MCILRQLRTQNQHRPDNNNTSVDTRHLGGEPERVVKYNMDG